MITKTTILLLQNNSTFLALSNNGKYFLTYTAKYGLLILRNIVSYLKVAVMRAIITKMLNIKKLFLKVNCIIHVFFEDNGLYFFFPFTEMKFANK